MASNRSCVQEFLKVYEVLRDGLLSDDVLGDQPKFAQQHLREVRIISKKSFTAFKSHIKGQRHGASPNFDFLSAIRALESLKTPLQVLKRISVHILQTLDYNVPGGKLNRGMAVADSLTATTHPKVLALEAFACPAACSMSDMPAS